MKRIFLIIMIISLMGCATNVIYRPLIDGDCVDRAIETRQYLREKGYEADIILGVRQDKDKDKIEGHAWIKYRKNVSEEWKIYKNY